MSTHRTPQTFFIITEGALKELRSSARVTKYKVKRHNDVIYVIPNLLLSSAIEKTRSAWKMK